MCVVLTLVFSLLLCINQSNGCKSKILKFFATEESWNIDHGFRFLSNNKVSIRMFSDLNQVQSPDEGLRQPACVSDLWVLTASDLHCSDHLAWLESANTENVVDFCVFSNLNVLIIINNAKKASKRCGHTKYIMKTQHLSICSAFNVCCNLQLCCFHKVAS